MNLDTIWTEYGLDKLEEGIRSLLPESKLTLRGFLEKVLAGDFSGALQEVATGGTTGFLSQFLAMKEIFIWLILLALISAFMTHFIELFDRHQVADLGFYFMYLLYSVLLLECFSYAAHIVADTLENILLFIRLMMPSYLFLVGVSTGTLTAAASGQILMLGVYGVEKIMQKLLLPVVEIFVLLEIVNGIWPEEKFSPVTEMIHKGVILALKGVVWAITGFGAIQSLITPAIDAAGKTGVKKLIAAIPGVGGIADGVVELVMGSASLLKRSVGAALLVVLLILCAVPLTKLLVVALVLKVSAAFMGIIADKRVVNTVNRVGDAGFLLLRITGAALLLFLIAIAGMTAVGIR
jgi:stage III sporulation protein AE